MIQKSNKTVIPEAFQFLLEFTNLPFKQGIASVYRPKKKLKRTPTIAPEKPKPLAKETIAIVRKDCKKRGFVDSETDKFIEGFKKNRGAITTNKKGAENYWSLNKGSFEFDGGNKWYPSGDEFRAFFESKDIVSTATCEELLWAWERHRLILTAQVNLNNGVEDDVSSIIWDVLDKYAELSQLDVKSSILINLRTYRHGGTIPLRIYAELLNFIHSGCATLLRQCSYCGRFWIKNDKRKDFCSLGCNNAFHKQSRPNNTKSVLASKKNKRTKKKKSDYSAIMDYYIKAGYSKESAEEHAREWVYDDKKTLENFKGHELKPNDTG